MQELNGKCAIITGASRGIGAAAAHQMASHGMTVVLAARSLNDSQAVARQICDEGGRALAVACDVSHYDQVEAAVTFTMENVGRLDVLVNNAGTIDPIARLCESDPTAWSQVVDIKCIVAHPMCSQGVCRTWHSLYRHESWHCGH